MVSDYDALPLYSTDPSDEYIDLHTLKIHGVDFEKIIFLFRMFETLTGKHPSQLTIDEMRERLVGARLTYV